MVVDKHEYDKSPVESDDNDGFIMFLIMFVIAPLISFVGFFLMLIFGKL